jgi:hypothetical protein
MPANKLLLALILFTSFQGIGQSDQKTGLDALASQFINYVRSDPKEKIILITDKTFYAADETIWFKALCLDSLSNRFIHKSRNLYVDLVDDRDSVISRMLLDIEAKKTSGKILLPGSLKEGYYWLRAYTKNILREDTNKIFVKPIYVLNASLPNSNSLSEYVGKPVSEELDTTTPNVVFFPEGGSIISGATATIAFRCTGAKGRPLNISGYISDTRNDTVANFSTTLPGIGKFSFDAFNPRKYTAHFFLPNHRETSFPLPRINQFGFQLSLIDQNAESFHLRVSLGDSLYKKNKASYVLGISRDSLCFAANGDDMYDVNVPKNSFPPGKATLFLFDDHDQVVSQRNIFIVNGDTNRVIVTADKSTYGARDKVKLNVRIVNNHDNQTAQTLFIVSVTDDASHGESEELNNQNMILFGRNVGEQQMQYSSQQIDLIMLAQKDLYPGFKFGDKVSIPNSYYDDSNLLSIKGKITNKKNEPLKNYIINVFSKASGLFKIDTTDENGHFQIKLPDYEDGTEFNLKLTNLKGQGQEGKVILDKFDFPQVSTPRHLKIGYDKSELASIRNFKFHQLQDTSVYGKESATLKPVTVTGQKPTAVTYDQSKRVSQFSTIITSANLNNGDINAIVNAVQNVPGFNAGMSTLALGGSYNVQPLIVMDGVILSLSSDVKSFLQSLDPASVDFIEILKGPQAAAYGMQGAGGVILINSTNERKQVSQINDKGISTIYPMGYAKQVDFNSPDYDKKEIRKATAPDQRITIYWNANLITDEKGSASAYFFTGDNRTTYTVVLTAITTTGNIFTKKLKFKEIN